MSRDALQSHFVSQLVEMGYTEPQAQTAVRRTHSVGVEAAVSWIVEHPDLCEASTSYEASGSSQQPALGFASTAPGLPVVGVPSLAPLVIHPDGQPAHAVAMGGSSAVKCVLVVATNKELPPGKLAAHSAQAAVGLYQVMVANQVPWMSALSTEEQPVVVCAESSADLEVIAQKADQQPVATFLLTDTSAVLSEACSHSVLALAGWSKVVDEIIQDLPEL